MYRIPNVVSWLLKLWITLRIKSNDTVFLTYDDGPHPESTPILLDLLNSFNVKATFFLTGTAAAAQPLLLQMILNNGHVVHLHGWSHLPSRQLTVKQWWKDIHKAREVVPGRYYRPPYGRISLRKLCKALQHQLPVILWNVDPRDYQKGDPDVAKMDQLIQKMRPGDIVLLHDKPQTLEKTLCYTNLIINKIREKGYRLSTIS
jgi:peptidoglycan/xylan/chitin deacetylase (PgdA/CDA1 family)